MRKCKECGEFKPLQDFIKNRKSRDGLALICTPCRHAILKNRRQFYLEEGFFPRSDGSCAGCKEFKPIVGKTCRCRDCLSELKSSNYHKNKNSNPMKRKAALLKSAALYQKDPNKFKERVRLRKVNNPHWVAELRAKQRAEELQRIPKWLTTSDRKRISFIYQLARMLTDVTGEVYQVDHIIPLRGKLVSGLHVPDNLQILTRLENIRKGNKW